METRIARSTKEVIISDDNPTVLMGERINSADKKKLQEALKAENLEMLSMEALAQAQAQARADMLNVNVVTFGVDEVALPPRIRQAVTGTVDITLCL